MQNSQASHAHLQAKLSAGVQRQLNELYFQQGLISRQLYETAKAALQKQEAKQGDRR